MWVLIVIELIALLVVCVLLERADFKKLKKGIDDKTSMLDDCLKKRWNLVPRFNSVVKSYIESEKDTLEELIKLRNTVYDNMNFVSKVQTGEIIVDGTNAIIKSLENNNDIKKNGNYIRIVKDVNESNEDLEIALSEYRLAIRNYNERIQKFPHNVFAFILGYKVKLGMNEEDSNANKES